MKKTILFAIVTVAVMWQANAQNVQELMYKAYLTNSTNLWKKAIDICQKERDSAPKSYQKLFVLAKAQYGLLNSTMSDKNEALFDKYLDSAKENLELLIEDAPNQAESKAILSAIYGLQMGYSPWKGMYLGSKSSQLIADALKEYPDSPLVNKLYAGSKLFTPEMFGGDINLAIDYYKKAIINYENDSSLLNNNWLYVDSMIFLGIAYEKANQVDNAISIYEKSLDIAPNLLLVKNVLLPKVLKLKK